MRTLSICLVCTFLLTVATAQEKVLKIHEERPSLKTSEHKPRDVEVYKTVMYPGTSKFTYGIAFFRTERDSLKIFQAFYGSDNEYDRASFLWKNDTTVSVTLYHSETKKQKNLTVWGHKGWTGMSDD